MDYNFEYKFRITNFLLTLSLEQLQNTIVGFITTTLLAYLLYILLECPSNNLIKIFEQQNPNQVIYPNHNNIDLNNNNNNILFVENKKTINKYNECSKLQLQLYASQLMLEMTYESKTKTFILGINSKLFQNYYNSINSFS